MDTNIDIPAQREMGDLSMKVKSSMVTFHGVNYDVSVKPVGKCCAGSETKRILHDVSGAFRPGSMNAIMGSTGSGKTSLLDVLAARKHPQGLEGAILIDGQPQPKNFRCMSGYVVQDDVVMGTLTIRENLLFSANLRLPRDEGADRNELVNGIINELGLSHVADSKVGTEFIRGVSGGERKRTNIGMELIISPSVLFLDEPTTGLDSNTANTVMSILYRLSRRGRTIIFSIHQPRYSIFRLFDQLMLLSKGHVLYHGPSPEATEYFSSIGYDCEAFNNPADFFLDLMNGDLENLRRMSQGSVGGGVDERSLSFSDSTVHGNEKLVTFLTDKYLKSQWHSNLKTELAPIYDAYVQRGIQGHPRSDKSAGYATSFLTQFGYLSQRTVINLARNPRASIAQVMIMIVFALIVGLIFRNVGDDERSGIQNRIGVFFFIVMNQVFGNLSSVELFIKERAIFIHENANGFYRVSAYFLSKVVCDVIPMRFIPLIFFSVITYFMIGLDLSAGQFFVFFIVLFATSVMAASIGFLMSSIVEVLAIANLFIALSFVIMMVFGGFLVNVTSIDVWLQWLKYISLFRYALNALYINELKDLELCDYSNVTHPVCDPQAGNKFLRSQNISYETDWDLWKNPTALFIMTVVLLVLTYIALRRIKKFK